MKHTHTWRRWSTELFLCNHPECFIKWNINFIDGKVAECPKCKKQFIVIAARVKPDQILITCENCGDHTFYPCTVEEAKTRLERLARETYVKDLGAKSEEFRLRENKLREQEKELAAKESMLESLKKDIKERYRQADTALIKRKDELAKIRTSIRKLIKDFRAEKRETRGIQRGLEGSIAELLQREFDKI